jgi:hypothetical protein
MKTKILTGVFIAAAAIAFGIGFAAQRSFADQTQKGPATQGQTNSGMMGGCMMNQGQGMMGQGMMGMMGQMTSHHQTMSNLMKKLMQSMSAIQGEKDPEALKLKLAEHQALLEQMRGQIMQQGNKMQMMSGQIRQSCPGAGDTSTAPTK